MKYVLLEDDCNNCRYVSSAFTFLKLPLITFSIEEFFKKKDSHPDINALIACKNIEETHKKKLFEFASQQDLCFISFHDQHVFNAAKPIFTLKPYFSKNELKQVLSHCKNYTDYHINLINKKYPIFEKLVGTSSAINKLKLMIKQVAASDSTVLLLGPSGVGKDVVASCIHYLSNRKDKTLVPINCGAIPNELMESELFGHEKGAFTGALAKRQGRFELADQGTLFLDEIGDMPLSMQVKLLRVLQDKKIERVGGTQPLEVDVRLIAATNKNLIDMIEHHAFREDLFYRINVFPIPIPSLQERRDDIPYLIDYHLERIQERLHHCVHFTETAKNILCDYAWPGNVRELQNFLERMVILYPDCCINEDKIDAQYKKKVVSPFQKSNVNQQQSFVQTEILVENLIDNEAVAV